MGLDGTPLPGTLPQDRAMSDPRSSFEQLHAAYRAKVRSYLCRFVEPEEAEDLTQEVFLKVHQHLPSFRAEAKLSTWIFQIATHAALDRLKSASHRIHSQKILLIEKLEDLDHHAAPDHGSAPVHDEMRRCIHSFIEDLPVNYRAILFLSELKELGIDEIARILDITPGAAKIRLHRARQALKASMEQGCRILVDERGELNCDRK